MNLIERFIRFGLFNEILIDNLIEFRRIPNFFIRIPTILIGFLNYSNQDFNLIALGNINKKGIQTS